MVRSDDDLGMEGEDGFMGGACWRVSQGLTPAPERTHAVSGVATTTGSQAWTLADVVDQMFDQMPLIAACFGARVLHLIHSGIG
jgi:hypothetical protein